MAEEALVQETKKELIEAAKTLPPMGTFSLRPRNFEEAYRFANLIATSDLIPKEFRDKPANVLVAVQLGMELGVSPMQALQNIAVINGRPMIFGDLLPAIIFQSGLLESIHEEGDEKAASCTVKRKEHEPITRTFTMAEAEKAGLPARNPTYKTYPKRMLQMRARALALRDMFPDVLKGVAVREEVEDYASVDITPESKPEPLKTPQALTAEKKADDGKSKDGGSPRRANAEHVANGAGEKTPRDTDSNSGSTSAPDNTGEQADTGEPPIVTITREEQALMAIDSYTAENFPKPNALSSLIKGLNGSQQAKVCAAYNNRKKELGL